MLPRKYIASASRSLVNTRVSLCSVDFNTIKINSLSFSNFPNRICNQCNYNHNNNNNNKIGIRRYPVASLGQLRHINDNSWMAEELIKKGEKLEPVGIQPDIIVTDKLHKQPSDKVMKLTEQILNLTIVEINQLLFAMQERLGVSDEQIFGHGSRRGGGGGGGDGGGSNASASPAAATEPIKEKEAFDIKLTVVDAKAKIKIIKEVRAITGLGLKEAKDLVEKAPVVIKQGVKKEDAESIKKILLEAGAQIEVL